MRDGSKIPLNSEPMQLQKDDLICLGREENKAADGQITLLVVEL